MGIAIAICSLSNIHSINGIDQVSGYCLQLRRTIVDEATFTGARGGGSAADKMICVYRKQRCRQIPPEGLYTPLPQSACFQPGSMT